MDALEALRRQGRKVGLITHVKEMTEKIPVRIVVNKERNGASTITIEGWCSIIEKYNLCDL